jgi:hypothetical protein
MKTGEKVGKFTEIFDSNSDRSMIKMDYEEGEIEEIPAAAKEFLTLGLTQPAV